MLKLRIDKQLTQNIVILAAGFLILSTFGCSSPKPRGPQSPEGYSLSQGSDREKERPHKAVKRFPWETWGWGRDLQGKIIKHPVLLQADEALQLGDTNRAQTHYKAALEQKLSESERETATLRMASIYLAAGDSNSALKTMSDYFALTGRTANHVDSSFSLIFAYAYGHQGDIEQSLAWFSRVGELPTARPGMTQGSRQGIKLLLRSLPNETLFPLTNSWGSDPLVYQLIAEEKTRRQKPGLILPVRSQGKNPFWEFRGEDAEFKGDSADARAPNTVTIGALLPLSGRYAGVGGSLKKGIDLALMGSVEGVGDVSVAYRDTGTEISQALASATELMSIEGIQVILGPVLSEHVTQIGEVSRENRISLLTFSKSGRLAPGAGVFRLGPTAESQVASLLATSDTVMGLRRYAIIYPQDIGGEEFRDIFKRELELRNLDLVFERSFHKGDEANFVELARQLESVNVEAVFFPDNIHTASRFFSSLSPAVHQSIRPLGTALWDNSGELSRSAIAFDGAIYVSPFFPDSSKPVIAKFVEAYLNKYNEKPDFPAAQGFDAATLVLAAIREQRENSVEFESAFAAIDTYEGLTGKIMVDSGGELRREFAVVEFRNGVVAEVKREVNSILAAPSIGTKLEISRHEQE